MSPDSLEFTTVLHRWVEVFMRRSMHDFSAFSRQSGLSMSQLNAMLRLYHRGDCGVSDLGDHLGVTNAAASQMIDKLVALGLLERMEDPSDRRAKTINLSQAGRTLIHEAIDARRRWMEALTRALSEDEQNAITGALTLLTQAALELEPAPEAASSNLRT